MDDIFAGPRFFILCLILQHMYITPEIEATPSHSSERLSDNCETREIKVYPELSTAKPQGGST
jgi:hypothetical protein